MISGALREDDFPTRAKDPVPRQVHAFRYVSQGVCSLPRMARKPRPECDVSVRRYSSARNRCDHIPDFLKGGIRLEFTMTAGSTTFRPKRPQHILSVKSSPRHKCRLSCRISSKRVSRASQWFKQSHANIPWWQLARALLIWGRSPNSASQAYDRKAQGSAIPSNQKSNARLPLDVRCECPATSRRVMGSYGYVDSVGSARRFTWVP